MTDGLKSSFEEEMGPPEAPKAYAIVTQGGVRLVIGSQSVWMSKEDAELLAKDIKTALKFWK